MQLFKYLTLAFATLAVAAPASKAAAKATANTIIADIGVIRQKNAALYQAVLPFKGGLLGLPQALKISSLGDDVSKAIKQTIKDANGAAPFTDDEALSIGLAVNDLSPEVIQTLDAFKSKRAAFDKPFPLSPIVKKTLQDQKKITVDLANAITAKVPDQFKTISASLTKPLLDKFDEVIKAFS